MKVQELRDMIKGSDRALVEKAFVESYKQLTKRQKEDADDLIRAVLSGENAGTGQKKETVSFQELSAEIKTFLENAKAGNYYIPNRIIPKSQRPKWRFHVKRYIKELEKIQTESEYYQEAVNLLRDIYSLLCTACNFYLFSTEDPFRSVGWAQNELYRLLVSKTFADGYTRENIMAMSVAACTGGISRISLYYDQELELVSLLRISDVKKMPWKNAIRRSFSEKRKFLY